MKKLIVFLFVALSLNSYAQNSFPTSNAIWNEEYRISPWGFHQYGMKGETIINDTLYQNLYILSDTTLDCINEQSLPCGFIRQEEQKVYFKPYGFYGYYVDDEWIEVMYPDFLLYDFGASVGDTIWHGWGTYDGGNFYVDEIFSIIQNIEIENGRKIYYIDGCGRLDDVWYEGLGSYRGLFGHIFAIPLYESFPNKLVCFKHNNIVEFLDNPKCNRCFCTNNSIDDAKIETIQIFPNPTDGILSIRASNNEIINRIEIMDMNGKTINQHSVNAEEFELNIFALPSANYLINVITNKSIHTQKIIKR